MNHIRSTFAVGIAALAFAASGLAQAQTTKKELTPQQARMGECAHEGKGKKGDEYKQFMKDCLKSKKDTAAAAASAAAKPAASAAAKTAAAPAPAASAAPAKQAAASQKDKMKTCNAQAKEKSLKGDARKTFMSDCLKA